eukprot:1161636-Pelagomonas_calceolata.AAC.7
MTTDKEEHTETQGNIKDTGKHKRHMGHRQPLGTQGNIRDTGKHQRHRETLETQGNIRGTGKHLRHKGNIRDTGKHQRHRETLETQENIRDTGKHQKHRETLETRGNIRDAGNFWDTVKHQRHRDTFETQGNTRDTGKHLRHRADEHAGAQAHWDKGSKGHKHATVRVPEHAGTQGQKETIVQEYKSTSADTGKHAGAQARWDKGRKGRKHASARVRDSARTQAGIKPHRTHWHRSTRTQAHEPQHAGMQAGLQAQGNTSEHATYNAGTRTASYKQAAGCPLLKQAHRLGQKDTQANRQGGTDRHPSTWLAAAQMLNANAAIWAAWASGSGCSRLDAHIYCRCGVQHMYCSGVGGQHKPQVQGAAGWLRKCTAGVRGQVRMQESRCGWASLSTSLLSFTATIHEKE